MIGRDELVSLSKSMHLRPSQQEKHYVQSLVLNALSEEQIVFKGGTYLWFFHGLHRFSEDLDFTIDGTLTAGLAGKVSESLRLFGIENEIKPIYDDERSLAFRISAKGPLNTSDIDVCFVYVEMSKREKILRPTFPARLDSPAYGIPTRMIKGMSLDEVSAEKVRAILTWDKARDMFDLAFLIANKGIRFDPSLVEEKLRYYDLRFSETVFFRNSKQEARYGNRSLGSLVFGELPDAGESVENIRNWIG